MKWITRENANVDRVACPWLIRRFIDPNAEFIYVPTDQVMAEAERQGAIPYDVAHVELGHVDGRCSFDSIMLKYNLMGDPALVELAKIVHAADIDSEVGTDSFAPALLALAFGGLDVEADDHRLLDRASFVYDALYAWCAQQVAAGVA